MFQDRAAIVDEICKRLAQGEPLAQICRDLHMPGVTTVWEWCRDDKRISESIAQARAIGFDVIADDCLTIADTPMEGVEITTDEKGTSEKRGDMLGHRKLQIETRLKLLAKWDPKRYGDKQQLEHSVAEDTAASGLVIAQGLQLTVSGAAAAGDVLRVTQATGINTALAGGNVVQAEGVLQLATPANVSNVAMRIQANTNESTWAGNASQAAGTLQAFGPAALRTREMTVLGSGAASQARYDVRCTFNGAGTGTVLTLWKPRVRKVS